MEKQFDNLERVDGDNFFISTILGSGAQGTVYLCKLKKDILGLSKNSIYAVKVCHFKDSPYPPDTSCKVLCHEYNIVTSLDHPGIIRYHAIFILTRKKLVGEEQVDEDKAVCILMERVIGKDLFDKIRDRETVAFSIPDLFKDLLEILIYLDERKILHNDIKPENVLLDPNGKPKLIDFGFSDNLEEARRYPLVVGTPFYLSPCSIRSGKSKTQKKDLWALGITIAEVCGCEIIPYSAQSPKEVCVYITKEKLLLEELEGYWFAECVKLCLCAETDNSSLCIETDNSSAKKVLEKLLELGRHKEHDQEQNAAPYYFLASNKTRKENSL